MDPRNTAAPVAWIRHQESSRPKAERLFNDPYAQLFDDNLSSEVMEMFTSMPFFAEHIRLRTRYIDETVRTVLANGVRNIVLVGAGFDSRALRMPEISMAGARVIEIDHADQIAEKKRRFAMAGIIPPPHDIFAPADLSKEGELSRALRDAGLAEGSRVHWICEGLFGYLSLEDIAALAKNTADLSGPGSSLVANHVVAVWNTKHLQGAFASSTWKVFPGPSYVELHRKWIGPKVPPGGEEFAFLEARC
jgi:methyltransferase (TIGR00027 family)